MSVRVVFFGVIADKLGRRESIVPASEGMTMAALISLVGCADFKPLLVALNQEQVNDMSRLIKDGDEVAMMPPFSGG